MPNIFNYKSSAYNHSYKHQDGNYLLFNARTLALASVSANMIQKLATPQELSEEDRSSLAAEGFLLPIDYDEKIAISKNLWQARNEQSFCSLTIAPTMGCNFNCHYCFESEEIRSVYKKMDDQVQSQLILFLREHFVKYKTKELKICWFGGEPLLAIDVIQKLSKRITNLCEEFSIKFPRASIITNGYRLTKKNAQILQACRITDAQVTIDGPEAIHDNRRVLKGGAGSFRRIIKNFNEASDFINIIIRVNVDKQNQNYLHKMVEEFKEQIKCKNISISLAPVNINPFMPVNYQAGINHEEFSLADAKFHETIKGSNVQLSQSPALVSNACGADHKFSYMIGPLGEIYQCWEDFGNPNLALGNVFEGKSSGGSYIESYYDFDPTQHPKCTDCTVMPLCMGGCPKQRLNNNGIPQCGIYKHNLEIYVMKQFKKLNKSHEYSFSSNDQVDKFLKLDNYIENLHKPFSNNYVYMLVSKKYELPEYLDKITELNGALNRADMSLIRVCHQLMKSEANSDLYGWAKCIKEKNNLYGIYHAEKVINYIEENLINSSISDYLSENKSEILDNFLEAPDKLLKQIRINCFFGQNEVLKAVDLILQEMSNDFIFRLSIDRIELAKLDIKNPENNSNFPTLIIYLNMENYSVNIFPELFRKFFLLLKSINGLKPNNEFAYQWLKSVTVTQGFKLYKRYLKMLGLLESLYTENTNYAFHKESAIPLLATVGELEKI